MRIDCISKAISVAFDKELNVCGSEAPFRRALQSASGVLGVESQVGSWPDAVHQRRHFPFSLSVWNCAIRHAAHRPDKVSKRHAPSGYLRWDSGFGDVHILGWSLVRPHFAVVCGAPSLSRIELPAALGRLCARGVQGRGPVLKFRMSGSCHIYIYIYIYIHTHTHTHTQGVPGGMCQTSGGCSLC